jgi:hypothetical protein
MKHQLPFAYFKRYVNVHFQNHEVYLNLFCLIEMYKTKVSLLLGKARSIKSNQKDGESVFDPKMIDDPEFHMYQIMIGKSMLNLLEYIKQNYQSHFKDLKIEEFEHFSLHTFQDISVSDQNTESHISSIMGNRKGSENHISVITVKENNLSARDIYLICGIGQLEPYQFFINFSVNDQALRNMKGAPSISFADQVRKEVKIPVDFIFCHPLCFDKFYDRCKEKLNIILYQHFKKDRMFNDLLFELCKVEIQQAFLEKA